MNFFLQYFSFVKCFDLCEVIVIFVSVRARISSKCSFFMNSSGCRPDAFKLSYTVIIPSTLSSMLTLLRLISSHKFFMELFILVY